MWQTPSFMLKLSMTCFLIGLVILVWDAAERTDVKWMNDDLKVCNNNRNGSLKKLLTVTQIAALFTIAVGTSLILYSMSVFGLFFKTVA
jgi:hypothetical protein